MGKQRFPDTKRDEKYAASPAGNKFEQSRPDQEKIYKVINRQNAPQEIVVGREFMRFEPNETKNIPESIVKHPDFLKAAKYFTVVE